MSHPAHRPPSPPLPSALSPLPSEPPPSPSRSSPAVSAAAVQAIPASFALPALSVSSYPSSIASALPHRSGGGADWSAAHAQSLQWPLPGPRDPPLEQPPYFAAHGWPQQHPSQPALSHSHKHPPPPLPPPASLPSRDVSSMLHPTTGAAGSFLPFAFPPPASSSPSLQPPPTPAAPVPSSTAVRLEGFPFAFPFASSPLAGSGKDEATASSSRPPTSLAPWTGSGGLLEGGWKWLPHTADAAVEAEEAGGGGGGAGGGAPSPAAHHLLGSRFTEGDSHFLPPHTLGDAPPFHFSSAWLPPSLSSSSLLLPDAASAVQSQTAQAVTAPPRSPSAAASPLSSFVPSLFRFSDFSSPSSSTPSEPSASSSPASGFSPVGLHSSQLPFPYQAAQQRQPPPSHEDEATEAEVAGLNAALARRQQRPRPPQPAALSAYPKPAQLDESSKLEPTAAGLAAVTAFVALAATRQPPLYDPSHPLQAGAGLAQQLQGKPPHSLAASPSLPTKRSLAASAMSSSAASPRSASPSALPSTSPSHPFSKEGQRQLRSPSPTGFPHSRGGGPRDSLSYYPTASATTQPYSLEQRTVSFPTHASGVAASLAYASLPPPSSYSPSSSSGARALPLSAGAPSSGSVSRRSSTPALDYVRPVEGWQWQQRPQVQLPRTASEPPVSSVTVSALSTLAWPSLSATAERPQEVFTGLSPPPTRTPSSFSPAPHLSSSSFHRSSSPPFAREPAVSLSTSARSSPSPTASVLQLIPASLAADSRTVGESRRGADSLPRSEGGISSASAFPFFTPSEGGAQRGGGAGPFAQQRATVDARSVRRRSFPVSLTAGGQEEEGEERQVKREEDAEVARLQLRVAEEEQRRRVQEAEWALLQQTQQRLQLHLQLTQQRMLAESERGRAPSSTSGTPHLWQRAHVDAQQQQPPPQPRAGFIPSAVPASPPPLPPPFRLAAARVHGASHPIPVPSPAAMSVPIFASFTSSSLPALPMPLALHFPASSSLPASRLSASSALEPSSSTSASTPPPAIHPSVSSSSSSSTSSPSVLPRRRRLSELAPHELWLCPFNCAVVYRTTSSRSIAKHILLCPNRPLFESLAAASRAAGLEPADELGGRRRQKRRRRNSELLLHERWNCPRGCGTFFRSTSTKSIQKHRRECTYSSATHPPPHAQEPPGEGGAGGRGEGGGTEGASGQEGRQSDVGADDQQEEEEGECSTGSGRSAEPTDAAAPLLEDEKAAERTMTTDTTTSLTPLSLYHARVSDTAEAASLLLLLPLLRARPLRVSGPPPWSLHLPAWSALLCAAGWRGLSRCSSCPDSPLRSTSPPHSPRARPPAAAAAPVTPTSAAHGPLGGSPMRRWTSASCLSASSASSGGQGGAGSFDERAERSSSTSFTTASSLPSSSPSSTASAGDSQQHGESRPSRTSSIDWIDEEGQSGSSGRGGSDSDDAREVDDAEEADTQSRARPHSRPYAARTRRQLLASPTAASERLSGARTSTERPRWSKEDEGAAAAQGEDGWGELAEDLERGEAESAGRDGEVGEVMRARLGEGDEKQPLPAAPSRSLTSLVRAVHATSGRAVDEGDASSQALRPSRRWQCPFRCGASFDAQQRRFIAAHQRTCTHSTRKHKQHAAQQPERDTNAPHTG